MTVGHLYCFIAILAIVIVANEVMHSIERRQLYRYIKADNIKEVDRKNTTPPKAVPSGHREALDKWRGKRSE